MKKLIAVSVLAAAVVSAMFAAPWSKNKGKKGKKKAAATKLITVGYAQVGAESDWRLANTASFKDTFTEANGYKLIFDDAQQKQENQIKAIRNFIQQDVDYIVVAPVVETGWETVLQEAKKAGIPVILSDRQMKGVDDLFTAWVGGNFLKEAEDACKWLDAYLKAKGRDKETINIVDLQGTIGASAQIGRTQGLENAVKTHKNWKIVAQQTGEFTQSKGQEVMESILKSTPDIDVAYCENDNMAWGAIDALKAAGKKPGKDVIVITFDAVRESFNRIINGEEINCAQECNPLHGPRVAELIQKLEKGEKVDKIAYVTELTFDKNGIGGALKAADEIGNRKY